MRIDASASFVPLGGNQSLVAADGVNIASVQTIDLLGAGVGVPPPNIIGNVSLFGADIGVGRYKQTIEVCLGTTALAASGAATLNVALQLAPDTGAAGGYLPGTWQTVGETGPMTLAQLQALQAAATQGVIRLEWPPDFPQNLQPRYAQLLFQVPAATHFTAGTIAQAFVTNVRDDLNIKNAAKNFSVS